MKKTIFVIIFIITVVASALRVECAKVTQDCNDSLLRSEREYWVTQMIRMSDPIIRNLNQNTLRVNIPVGRSSSAKASSREFITHMNGVDYARGTETRR
jgi:hypothetical protein